MPVYAVISHGKTGFGAFLDGGGRTVAQGASEAVNATLNNGSVVNDQVIYDLRHDSSNDNTFYDDIVHWQTQSNLMARLRRDSCALP